MVTTIPEVGHRYEGNYRNEKLYTLVPLPRPHICVKEGIDRKRVIAVFERISDADHFLKFKEAEHS